MARRSPSPPLFTRPARSAASTASAAGNDDGSATVLVVMSIGVLLIVLAGAMALLSAIHASHRARAAADLAAVGAAEVAVGNVPGDPCREAAHVAGANHAVLQSCSVDGQNVTVRVAVATTWSGLPAAVARARAGPDPSLTSSGGRVPDTTRSP